MTKNIYLVTSNPHKIEVFNQTLHEFAADITVEILQAEYPEDKADNTTSWVVLQGARYCAERYQKPVMVTDTGLFIEALNGFPGVNTKFTLERIGNEGLLKLLEGVVQRQARWLFSLGYCEPGLEPEAFTAEVSGQISTEIRGVEGFGFDPIFIVAGYQQTLAEDIAIRDAVNPFRKSLKMFLEHYQTNQP